MSSFFFWFFRVCVCVFLLYQSFLFVFLSNATEKKETRNKKNVFLVRFLDFVFVNKMTEKLKAIFNIRNEQSPTITVRICSTTGDVFQETFSNNQLTIGQMKFIAMKSLLDQSQMEKKENYKLISMDTKRTMDEQKTLKEEKVKDGGE